MWYKAFVIEELHNKSASFLRRTEMQNDRICMCKLHYNIICSPRSFFSRPAPVVPVLALFDFSPKQIININGARNERAE